MGEWVTSESRTLTVVLLGLVAVVVILIVGAHVTLRFFATPAAIKEQRRVCRQIAEALDTYAPVYLQPDTARRTFMDEASYTLQSLSAELKSTTLKVPALGLFVVLRLSPSWRRVVTAALSLEELARGLYHSGEAHHSENKKRRQTIMRSLGIRLHK